MFNDPLYMDNVALVTTEFKQVEVKNYKGFAVYPLGSFYAIEYFGFYKKAQKIRTYKTYKAMLKTWTAIVREDIDYGNF